MKIAQKCKWNCVKDELELVDLNNVLQLENNCAIKNDLYNM